MANHMKVLIEKLPNCDMCMAANRGGEVAKYDAKTKMGPWGYLCDSCFNEHGVGLGTGRGQELVVPSDEYRDLMYQLEKDISSDAITQAEYEERFRDINTAATGGVPGGCAHNRADHDERPCGDCEAEAHEAGMEALEYRLFVIEEAFEKTISGLTEDGLDGLITEEEYEVKVEAAKALRDDARKAVK